MMWRFIREMLGMIWADVKHDFEPSIKYAPYRPHVLGSVLRSERSEEE